MKSRFNYIIGMISYMSMMTPCIIIAEFGFGIPSWESTGMILIPMILLLIPTNFIIEKLEPCKIDGGLVE